MAECGYPVDIMTLLASAIVVDSTGKIGINAVFETVADCANVDPYLDCGMSGIDPVTLLKNVFTVDACGNVAVRFISKT